MLAGSAPFDDVDNGNVHDEATALTKMKQTGECTPLATPASSNLHSMQVPLVYVQPEAIRGEYMSDRNMGIPQPGDGPQFWKAGVFECLQNIFPNGTMNATFAAKELAYVVALMAWACPCVSLAQITSRLGVFGGYKSVLVGVATIIVLENLFNGIDDWRMHRENQQTFDDDVHESQTRRMGGYGIVSLLLCMALVCFVTALRTKVRTLYRIQGSEWEDFACSLCCMSCTIAQMSTQVGTYTPGECAFGPRDSLPRYTEHV